MIALAASCTAGASEPGAAFRVDRIEAAGGQPYFLAGELGRIAAPIADVTTAPDALAPALPAIADALRVPAADLIATRAERDSLGMTHVRYAQHKHGLRVVGGDVVLHVGADGTVKAVNSTAKDRALDPTPALAAGAAEQLAIAATAGTVAAHRSELVYVISTGDGELYLAWEVLVIGSHDLPVMDFVYVDALAGAVVDRRPQVFTTKNRVIQDGGGQAFPVFSAPQVGSEGSPPAGDDVALAAYTNTGSTYDCYQALFQRDSYDNAGAKLTSTVHVVFSTGGGGTSGNNAVWFNSPIPTLLESQMAYGDGDGTFMTPLAYAYDVTAHELTHAVTSATANLAYQNESGALNEGMSDIMAAVCEAWKDQAISADTWLVGEDIFTPATAGDALRYMANPTADSALYPPELGGSRDFYADRYTGTQDNGGVHLNSGIPNLAFHLLVEGGTHPRGRTTHMVTGLGMEKAGAIFYRALTGGYFTANTNLAQARTATEQVAQEMYPGCTRTAVSSAWAAVGVGSVPPPDAAPPTTEITAPADGARVQPGFQVQVNANDDSCVLKVELSVDGALVETLTAPPFTFTTAASLAPGMHTIEVTTYDAASSSTDTATVTIAAPDGGGGGGMCTTNDQCGDGETCQSGTCQMDGDPAGCGCASGDGRGAAGALALFFATAFALRRRRVR
jgi:MYXO-CTERM domain-containing protein